MTSSPTTNTATTAPASTNPAANQVQPGQNLSTIAQNAGMTAGDFAKLNPQFAGTGNGYYNGLSNNVAAYANYNLAAPLPPAGTPTSNVNPNLPAGTPVGTPVNPLAGLSLNDPNGNQTDVSNIYASLGSANPTSQEMSDTRQKFQAQIDALNGVYAQEKARLVDQGNGRMNQTSAIQARQGLLNTGFAGQQDQKQTDANNQILAAADAKHNLDIQNIMSQVNQDANVTAKNRYEAATKGADAKINEIQTRGTRQSQAVNSLAQQLINNGVDITKVTPDQLQAFADSQNAKTGFNVTPNDISSAYKSNMKTITDAKTKTDLENAKSQSTIDKNKMDMSKPIEVGGRIYKANATGGYDNVGVKYTAPKSSSSLPRTLSSSQQKNEIQTALTTGKTSEGDALGAGRGADGYADPSVYIKAFSIWKGTTKDFLNNFPVEKNVNPASYGLLPVAIKPARKI